MAERTQVQSDNERRSAENMILFLLFRQTSIQFFLHSRFARATLCIYNHLPIQQNYKSYPGHLSMIVPGGYHNNPAASKQSFLYIDKSQMPIETTGVHVSARFLKKKIGEMTENLRGNFHWAKSPSAFLSHQWTKTYHSNCKSEKVMLACWCAPPRPVGRRCLATHASTAGSGSGFWYTARAPARRKWHTSSSVLLAVMPMMRAGALSKAATGKHDTPVWCSQKKKTTSNLGDLSFASGVSRHPFQETATTRAKDPQVRAKRDPQIRRQETIFVKGGVSGYEK